MPVVLAENQPMELRWVGVVVYVENKVVSAAPVASFS